jgi:hypothetical protein
MVPILISWATFSIKNGIRISSLGAHAASFSPTLVASFHAAGSYIDGGFAVEQGAFFAALILSTATVHIIDRRLYAAAAWLAGGALMSLLGLVHAWRFEGADTVGSLPLLERLTHVFKGGSNFPAASYAAAYAILAAILVVAKWFTVDDGAHQEPGT